MVHSSTIIMNVTNGHIDRPIFILTCCDVDHNLIAVKNDWQKCGPISGQPPSDLILNLVSMLEIRKMIVLRHMACLQHQFHNMKFSY